MALGECVQPHGCQPASTWGVIKGLSNIRGGPTLEAGLVSYAALKSETSEEAGETSSLPSRVVAFGHQLGSYFSMSTVREIGRGPIKPFRPLAPTYAEKQSCPQADLGCGDLASTSPVTDAAPRSGLGHSSPACLSAARVPMFSFIHSPPLPDAPWGTPRWLLEQSRLQGRRLWGPGPVCPH